MKTWRYEVKNTEKCEGWAILLIDETGFFGVCSDYGDYAYLWAGHGRKDFREFVIGLVKNPEYAANKLSHGVREYDAEATQKNVRARILELRRDGRLEKDRARDEWDMSADMYSFDAWLTGTSLAEGHEYYCTVVNRQAMAFCKNVLPRLAAVISADLAFKVACPICHSTDKVKRSPPGASSEYSCDGCYSTFTPRKDPDGQTPPEVHG